MIIESSDAKEVKHLLVHLLLTIDDGAHHLLFVGINGRHLEVEVHLWGFRLATNVHQTVHTNGIVGKRVANVEVGEADTINGIDSLKIEGRIVGITTKDDGTTTIKGEVLLDNVLDSDAVSAMVYGIGSEHVECPFVMERGTDGAVAIEGDVIVGCGIHQQTHGSLWRGVNQEVNIDIGIRGACRSRRRGGTGYRGGSGCIPFDKLLLGDGIRAGGVVYKDGTRLRGDVTVDGHIVVTSMDIDTARGVYSAVEDVVSEVAEIVAKQILRLYIEVETEAREVFVVDTARKECLMTITIVKGHMAQLDIIWHHHYRIVLQPICGIERRHSSFAFRHYDLTRQVDIVQRTCYTGMTSGMAIDTREETLCEVVHEGNGGTLGVDSKIDVLMNGRHMTIDVSLGIRTIVGNGVDIYLLQFLIPVCFRMQHTHVTLLKLEIVYTQIGCCGKLAQQRRSMGATCCFTTELYAVEIDKIQNIAHLYLVQINGQ